MAQKRIARWSIGSGIAALLGMINPDLTRHVLNDAWQSTLAQALVVITIVWFTMGRKVASGVRKFQSDTLKAFQENFDKMETAVQNVATGLGELRETVGEELKSHSKLIGNVKLDVAQLKDRVNKLEGSQPPAQ